MRIRKVKYISGSRRSERSEPGGAASANAAAARAVGAAVARDMR